MEITDRRLDKYFNVMCSSYKLMTGALGDPLMTMFRLGSTKVTDWGIMSYDRPAIRTATLYDMEQAIMNYDKDKNSILFQNFDSLREELNG